MVRVVPVLLIVNKVEKGGGGGGGGGGGASASAGVAEGGSSDEPYAWEVAFIPLWISVGVLAIMGFLVCFMVPLLVLTQDAAGRVLGWIMTIASLFMIIPAVCSLAFLILLCQYLNRGARIEDSGDCGGSGSHASPSLVVVMVPLFVMYSLLTMLTPVLVRVVNSTHNVLDAMQQAENPNFGLQDEDDERNRGNVSQGKRVGIERSLTQNRSDDAAVMFVRQTSTLFRKVVAGEEFLVDPVGAGKHERKDESRPDDEGRDTERGTAAEAADSGGGGGGGGGGGELEGKGESGKAKSSDCSLRKKHQQMNSGTETLCYVCCEKQRDSVLQPCGHGGMCCKCVALSLFGYTCKTRGLTVCSVRANIITKQMNLQTSAL